MKEMLRHFSRLKSNSAEQSPGLNVFIRPASLSCPWFGTSKRKQTMLVSRPARKQIRSNYSVLTSKKLNTLKNQPFFLDLSEK